MPLTIAIQDDAPFFDQTVELEGVSYLLHFQFNQREQRFYVSISTPDGLAIATGAALVCAWPLFFNQRGLDALPPGVLMCIPSGSDDSPPRLGELGPGKRCELVYFTVDELVP